MTKISSNILRPDQKRIYDDWRERGASRMSQEDYEKQMAALERMMAAMAGGGGN